MLKILLPLIACALCCSDINAQTDAYRFKNWDQQKGMPTNSCLSVMQDRNGYIWIATVNGISRFNGINFKEIGKYTNSPSIEGEVRKIIQDDENIYWIASYEKGLISIDFSQPSEKQVSVFNRSTLPAQDCPPIRTVKCILDDKKGHIWVGTESNGLYRFDKKAKTFSRWNTNSPYSHFSTSIRCLYQKADGMIWVGIVNGLIYINPSTGKTTHPKTDYNGVHYINPPTVRGICHLNKDTFAMATDRGAYFYLESSQTFLPVFPLKDSIQFKVQEYHDVIKFSDHELWFATIDRGIWYAEIHKKLYRYSWEGAISDETVGRHPVYNFYRDKDNHIWVCHNKGLSYLNQQKARFTNLPFLFHVTQPQSKNFLVAGKNEVAVIRPDGIFAWHPSDNTPVPYRLMYDNKNTGGMQIWKHDRLVYVLVNSTGIFYADTIKHLAKLLFLKKDLPAGLKNSGHIAQLFIDTLGKEEQWWFLANEDTLLHRYDWGTKKFTDHQIFKNTVLVDNKLSIYFSRMIKDSTGGLWIATHNQGLFYMPDRTKDAFVHFSSEEAAGKHLPGNYIEDIALDHNGKLWATIRGIGLVNIEINSLQQLHYTVYAKEQGLTYLNLNLIKVDSENNLWISSQNGLYRFDQNTKWFNYFGQPNGILNPALTLGSVIDSSGIIYFTSTDYLLKFNPNDFLIRESVKPLQLLSIAVNDRALDITNKNNLNLKANDNTLRFEFDVLDFDNSVGQNILCKLDNYDKNWLLLQDVFHQTYTSLPGGSYTFRLKKVNADGSHGKEIIMPLIIADHFYNTAWFRFLAVIVAGLVIFIAVRIYTNNKLQRQKIILGKKQVLELERLRISAELHDDMGGELSTIHLLSEMAQTNQAQNQQEQLIKISASSAGLVQKMNEIVWALNVKNDTLQSLISYIHRYAVKHLESLHIECAFIQPLMIPNYEVDGSIRRNIFLLIKEGLNNVVKHSNATSVFITVAISHELVITLHDNGNGIGAEKLSADSGNGLSTMQKRARDVNGTMCISNDNGTTLEVRIPLYKTHTKV